MSKIFEFIDPDTGYQYKAQSLKALLRLILQYRVNNQLAPIENLDLVVENYLCEHPLNAGSCRPDIPLRRGLAATVKGGVLMLTSMLYRTFVTQEEADRRAAICVGCPHNVFPDKTRFVRWADAMAKAMIGDKKSKYNDELGNCEICTCPLRAKVFYNGDPELSSEEYAEMAKVGCWQVDLQDSYNKA